MDEEAEEKIQQLVKQEVERRGKETGEVDVEAVKQDIIEEIESRSEEQQENIVETLKDKCLTRRDFLKALGIGAGGLALTSSVSGAWGQWIASTQGKSDINADTVDGQHASDLGGRNVKRKRGGGVYSQNVGTGTTQTTTTGVTITTSMSTANYIVFDSFSGAITPAGAGANIKLYRNGSLQASTTTEGGNTVTAGAPRASNVNWTAKANFSDLYGGTISYIQERNGSLNSNSYHFWPNPDTPTGTWDRVKVRVGGSVKGSGYDGADTMQWMASTGSPYNGNRLTKTSLAASTTATTYTTTIKNYTYVSPSLYVVMHNSDDDALSGKVHGTWWLYKALNTATLTLTASRNQFYSP